jgi:hypothetical protein
MHTSVNALLHQQGLGFDVSGRGCALTWTGWRR